VYVLGCSEHHIWLLSSEVDILPHLLLPLAGPEEFTDDEVDKLPPELQYLPESKVREADPDIRRMLLEALLQVSQILQPSVLTEYKLTALFTTNRGHKVTGTTEIVQIVVCCV
jgi:hypothetical protein